jgi:hypothetical protein
MNGNSINDSGISIENSFTEQNPPIDNKQPENLTQTQSNSATSGNVTSKIKKTPMTPTRLYISFFFSQSS